MVCCPAGRVSGQKVDLPTCDPDYDLYDDGTILPGVYCEYDDDEDEDEDEDEDSNFIQNGFGDDSHVYKKNCGIGSKCVPKSQCGADDFSTDLPPVSCGFDETTGEDTFCCTFADPSSVGVDQTQPPIFPIEGSNPRPCIDHTTHCARWATDHPDSCNPGNLGYSFMREACQKSCERCGDKGCVDEYEKCPQWSRAGHCRANSDFMFFHCRESCGACGFKSPSNEELQTVGGKQYTDVSASNYMCGENKRLEEAITTVIDYQEKGDEGLCTNVLISDRFSLTAAHCLEEGADRFRPKEDTREAAFRRGTEFEEKIGIKREWIHPWRISKKTQQPAYYDIVVQELERRVIFDYEKFGDSPVCLGEIGKDGISGQIGVSEGFGKDERNRDGNIQQTNVTLLSNEECYEKLNNIMKTNVQGYNNRIKIQQAVYNGITDQLICTSGLIVEKCRKGRCRKFFSGPCPGDSGGPLFLENYTENGDVTGRTVIGIVSGGVGCGNNPDKKPNYPKWWARVSWFNEWIKCTTEKASIYSFSHKNVERECDACCSADPSPAECSHTGLFIEKVASPPKSCDENDLQTKGSGCFGEPDPQLKSNECS